MLGYSDSDGAHLVDAGTGEPVGPGWGGNVTTRVAFSSDGTVLAVDSTTTSSKLQFFDARTGAQLREFRAAAGDLRPGTDEVVTAEADISATVLQRFRIDGTPISAPVTIPGQNATWLRYTPDGSRLVLSGFDGLNRVLDPETLTPIGSPIGSSTTSGSGGGDNARDSGFSPDGKLVALALDSGTVLVAGTADGILRASLGGLGQAAQVTFLDDHRLLVSTPARSAEYDLEDVTPVGTVAAARGVISRLLVEPGGDRALLGQGRDLAEVDRAGTVVPMGLDLPLETEGPMALSPDGRRVAALGYPPGYHYNEAPDDGLPVVEHFADGVLVIVDRATGEVLVRTTVEGVQDAPVEGAMAFSPDGRRLAVGTFGGEVTLLDSATGEVLARRSFDELAERVLRWSSDGTVLYSAGGNGVLRFLDPASLRTIAVVTVVSNVGLNYLLPVPRTSLLAVADDAGQVLFVDPARRAVVGEPLAAQSAQLLALAASPDGARIAAVGWDGALRLWDRASGRTIGPPLEAYGDYTRSIAWFDRQHLLTGSFAGKLIDWDMAPAHWADRACELAGRDLTRAEWHRYLPDQPYRRTCD